MNIEANQPTLDIDNIVEVTLNNNATNNNKRKKTRSFIPKDDKGNVDKSLFTAEELEKVKSIGSKINFDDVNSIINFGTEPQNQLAAQSEKLLTEVKNYDSGEMSEMLTDLLQTMHNKGEDSNTVKTFKKIPLLGPALATVAKKFQGKVETVVNRHDSLSGNVNKIATNLDKSRTGIIKNNVTLSELFNKNIEFLKQLREHGIAGAIVLEQLKEKYADMQLHADEYEEYEISYLAQFIERLTKRLHDMEITHTVTFQSLPQIQQVQQNNSLMIERIQSTIANTIPVWKNQLVLSANIAAQQRDAIIGKEIMETTNKMLLHSSEQLKTNSIMIAEQNNQGMVKSETIQKITTDILDTITQLENIKLQGAKNREETAKVIEETQRLLSNRMKDLKV